MSQFERDTPFNTLPPLPPEANLESPEILKACIAAHRELAQLHMASRLIPNHTVLVHSLPLLESKASSEIENIVTSTDELFQFADSHSSRPSPEVKETLRYRAALFQGLELLKQKPLNITAVCEICSTIRGVQTDIRKVPGTTLKNDRSGEVIYTPPQGETILRDLLTNWQEFLHSKDTLDPLVKLAAQHYQFEAIHPFTDGNGRTGRIINLLYLIDQGLLDAPILYLSRYILKHRQTYYKLLLKVTTEQDWNSWVLFFLDGIKETAHWTSQKILAIEELFKETCVLLQEKAPLIYKKELVELLFHQPYVRIAGLVDHQIAERQTASKYLKTLCEIGLLEEVKVGREKLFIHTRFLELLKGT